MANSIHNKLIDLKSIEKINEGLLVLKHFFQLNKEILPIYFSLQTKKFKTPENVISIQKIEQLFSTFNFDSSTSKILMDSSILDDIHYAFFSIQNINNSVEEKQEALKYFFDEFKRIKKNWQKVAMN